MPGQVYSHRFVRAVALGSTQYVVGAGQRAVVRSIDIAAWGETEQIWCSVAGTYVAIWAPGGQSASYHVETRAVAYAGEVISVLLGGQSCNAMVSGYLFEDTGGRSGPPAGAVTLPGPGQPPAPR